MIVDAATERMLDAIARRSDDVARAFTPGAVPHFDDVTAAKPAEAFDPLAASAPDGAYFVLAGPNGSRAYTTDGHFATAGGALVGSDGSPVFGFSRDGAALEPLRVDPVDEALRRVRAPHVEADGSFVYERDAVDPRTGVAERERVVVGRVALARFPAATTLRPLDASRALAPPGVEPHLGRAGDGSFAALRTMHRSGSRIDFDRSLERLQDAYLAFDAVQAARKAQDASGKTAMDLLK